MPWWHGRVALDTANTRHGHRQLSLFNAHYDQQLVGFAAQLLPIQLYDAGTDHCVLTILRPDKTPDGKTVRAYPRRLVRRH
ncbi:MAG TPA: hypothetical protein VND19_23075 [Acetobacteraceae bacterium]|nr:hypothetical protein [Acetobacteraceae bacterium]